MTRVLILLGVVLMVGVWGWLRNADSRALAGMNPDLRRELFERSRRLVRATSPVTTTPDRDALWLEPALLAEISYSELMGGWLRDPVYRGLITT